MSELTQKSSEHLEVDWEILEEFLIHDGFRVINEVL